MFQDIQSLNILKPYQNRKESIVMDTIRAVSGMFLSYCSVQQRMSSNTLGAYHQDLRCFMEFLEQLDPPALRCTQWTAKVTSDYRSYLEEKYSAATIKRRLSSLHTFAGYLIKEGFLSQSPFDSFPLRSRKGVLHISVLNSEEIRRVRAAMHADLYADWAYLYIKQARDGYGLPTGDQISREVTWVRDMAILDLIFCFHLTMNELRSLEVGDFDPVTRVLQVHGYGEEKRSLFLGTGDGYWSLFDYNLLRVQIHVDTSALFISKFQTPMSAQGIRNLFNKYVRKARPKKPRIAQSYRHTFAMLLRKEGLNVEYLEDQLGRGHIYPVCPIRDQDSDPQKKRE